MLSPLIHIPYYHRKSEKSHPCSLIDNDSHHLIDNAVLSELIILSALKEEKESDRLNSFPSKNPGSQIRAVSAFLDYFQHPSFRFLADISVVVYHLTYSTAGDPCSPGYFFTINFLFRHTLQASLFNRDYETAFVSIIDSINPFISSVNLPGPFSSAAVTGSISAFVGMAWISGFITARPHEVVVGCNSGTGTVAVNREYPECISQRV